MSLLITFLYIVFVIAAIVLMVIILLQEGKGGGLSDALGTAGQQTFGVATKGIQRFTGIVAVVFLLSATAVHFLYKQMHQRSATDSLPTDTGPLIPGPGGGQ
jgi:preprotein translocase subunit SecG